jgi:hypothetical protein
MPMTLKLLSTAALASILGLALAACASSPPRDLGRLGFMVGCWKSATSEDPAAAVNLEVWSAPEGGLMFGYATTMGGGKLVTWEDSRIDLREGRAVYVASPEGQRATLFVETAPDPLALAAPGQVTFENPNHDYPQRITYRKIENGLSAKISKLDGSQPFEYSWVKVRCD